jgi:hypothetical protein
MGKFGCCLASFSNQNVLLTLRCSTSRVRLCSVLGSKYLTSPNFKWLILAETGHLNSGPFEYWSPFIRPVWLSNDSSKLDFLFIERLYKNQFFKENSQVEDRSRFQMA